MTAPAAAPRISFGLYEVDLQAGEIWKAGFRIKLQSQPFKVLCILLERRGQVVSREELQERLWGKDTVVDFDHSLGTAINKIREALGDSADNPRFIETLSRRGYRFIAPVGFLPAELVIDPTAAEHQATASAVATPPARRPSFPAAQPAPQAPAAAIIAPGKRRLYSVAGVAVLAISACAAAYLTGSSRSITTPPHIVQVTHNGHVAPSVDSMENLASVVTDGVHLYAATIDSGRSRISSISLTGGEVTPLNIPSEVASPALGDISPDGSRLLLRDHLSPEAEQPLWVVPTTGGSALRVGIVLAHDATWMPDGEGILFANGNELFLTHLNGNDPQPYASLPGRAFWLRWEPNGRLLRFTILDPLAHTTSLWQVTTSNHTAAPVLSGFSKPAAECCGVWSADGSAFVFQSNHGGNNDLWRLSGVSTSGPVRVTDGPLEFESPVAARTGKQIVFMGADARSELEELSPAGELIPEKGFLASAVRVDYTRDGKWVAWVDTSGQLWRARADGTEKLQITPQDRYVFMARWSPDGSHIAVMAREAGQAWKLYLTSANGGDFKPLLSESRNAADPSWSPDGQSLVFGRVNDVMGKENAARTLHLLHLQSGQLEQLPASDGLFSPRWSPDGRYIAALTLDQRQVRLFNVGARTWTTLAVSSGADPIWSLDGRYLFVHGSLDPAQPIYRISVPENHVDEVARLADIHQNDAVDYVFGGLTPDNHPLIRARVFTGNFYALDLK